MHHWTASTGYPVVRVSTSKINGTHSRIQLKQNRFLSSTNNEKQKEKTIWNIPFNIRYPTKVSSMVLYTFFTI